MNISAKYEVMQDLICICKQLDFFTIFTDKFKSNRQSFTC